MTAFEAKLPVSKSLGWPARNVAWIVTSIYVLTTFVFVLNIWWQDKRLPQFYNQGISGLVGGASSSCGGANNSTDADNAPKFAAPVIAVNDAGLSGGVLVACFIYSALSAANTGLYVSSRAIYGLTRDLVTEPRSPLLLKMLASLSKVEPRTQSPWWGITASVLLLCWLPFIHLSSGYTMEEVS